ncbi:hypothetical protein CBL_11995 [Carabus blaptoides fortunei]
MHGGLYFARDGHDLSESKECKGISNWQNGYTLSGSFVKWKFRLCDKVCRKKRRLSGRDWQELHLAGRETSAEPGARRLELTVRMRERDSGTAALRWSRGTAGKHRPPITADNTAFGVRHVLLTRACGPNVCWPQDDQWFSNVGEGSDLSRVSLSHWV